ncbi:MAG: glycoside-pentoside-hexuronide (GPH):cation symporter [Lachnospira sp.]|nr:glycoside-pentoside-hexuronide (GPH):cation symporter [Lachnospira sp.]
MKKGSSESQKVSALEQFGYFCGDFGGSLVNLYVSAFFLTFCTYVLGIDPKWMAGLILVAKIWDAINDPLIGSLPDHFHIGKTDDKFKPWVKLFVVPLAVSGLLCFTDVSSFPSLLKHTWVAVSYILYGMAYTGTSMPYGAMASVITTDPVERTKLSRARSFGGLGVGILFLPLVSLAIWDANNNPNAGGYFLMAVIAGIGTVIFYTMLIIFSKERVRQPLKYSAKSDGTKAKFSFFKVVKEAFTNRPLVGVMIASIGSMFYTSQSVSSYLFREYYHQPKAMAASSYISLPMMFLAFWLVPRLSQKIGKRSLILIGSVMNLIGYGLLLAFPIANPYVFMFANTVANFGGTIFIMLVWALVTDAIDYQEYKNGERSDGTLYSVYTFSRKIGSAIVSSITSWAIGAIGFVKGASVQPDSFGPNVRILMLVLPMIGALIILVGIGLIYNLNQKKAQEVHDELESRRKAAQADSAANAGADKV